MQQKRKNKRLDEDLLYGEYRDKAGIRKCDMIPTDTLQCHIQFSKKHVYSKSDFRPGQIIEICPVKKVTNNSLYSREIRDMVLEVEPGEFVLPMGYCQYYDIVDRENPYANCSWEWNAKKKCIIIRAIEYIPKGTVLVLDADNESL